MDELEEKIEEVKTETETQEDELSTEAAESLDALTAALGNDEEDEIEAPADDEKPAEADDKPADEEPGKTTEEPQVDDSLLEKAVKAGIPLASAKTFSKVQLEASIAAVEAAKPAEKTVEDIATEKEAEQAKPEKITFDDLLEDGFDQRVVDRLNKMAETTQKLADENATLKKQVQESVKAAEQASRATAEAGRQKTMADLETRFDALGEDFGFGKGKFADIDAKAHENRLAVMEEMATLVKGYQAAGKPVPTVEKLFNTAVFSVTQKPVTARTVEDPVPEKLKKRAAAAIGQPGGGKASEVSKAAKAYEGARKLSQVLNL